MLARLARHGSALQALQGRAGHCPVLLQEQRDIDLIVHAWNLPRLNLCHLAPASIDHLWQVNTCPYCASTNDYNLHEREFLHLYYCVFGSGREHCIVI